MRSDGSTEVAERGHLKDKEIREIQRFIKNNHEEMLVTWRIMSNKGYCGEL